ncbi:MAG: hypothetical protein Q8P15_03255 [Nanoarchaeota archaeon]|nr:hypothetical protein [Nanoarchaeota archaeon]
MVYKRYIHVGKKVYGPYLYKSRKKNGKVISDYVGKHHEKFSGSEWRSLILFFGLILIFSSIIFLNHSLTGNVIFTSSSDSDFNGTFYDTVANSTDVYLNKSICSDYGATENADESCTISFSSTNDTFLYSVSATTNFGTGTNMWIGGTSDNDGISNTLIYYDMSSLSGATIINSTMYAYMSTTSFAGSGTRTMDINLVKRDWEETEATYNIYSTGNDWATAGGVGTGDIDYTYNTSFSGTIAVAWFSIPMSAGAVQALIDNPSTYYGFIMTPSPYAGSNHRFIFNTREAASNNPSLNVTFTPGYKSSGSYLSLVENAGFDANWTNITWSETEPNANVNISVQVRSCDDAACSGESFGDFIQLGTLSNLNVANNQYFQYNVSFQTNDTSQTAVLEELSVGYMEANNIPSTPDLNAPLNATSFSSAPPLNWSNSTDSDGDAITYALEVSSDSAFATTNYSNYSISETSNTTGDVPTGLGDGTYYWRVLASDGVLNSSWSETRSFNISTPATPTTTTTTGGSSGGGGGGSSPIFSLDKDLIQVKIKQGDTQRETITIKNLASIALDFEIDYSELSDFLIISEYNFTLAAGESKIVNVDVFTRNEELPEIYTGRIVVQSGTSRQVVNVVIEVIEKRPLFDLRVDLSDKEVSAGEDLEFDILALNMGDLSGFDILLHYSIKDFENNVYTVKEESIKIDNQLDIKRTLKVPENLEFGKYILYAKISYQNITATGIDTFEVFDKKTSTIYKSVLFILILLIILVLAILIFVIRRRKSNKNNVNQNI